MIVPPVGHRREIDRNLADFFRRHRVASFRRAISQMCRYYGVARPRIEWFEYIDWGKTAGKTYEDGRIHLVHPENWKRGRVYNSERMWVQMIYHEMAHYLFWTDAERKAELFTRRMVRGLRASARKPRGIRSRAAYASARRGAERIRRRRARTVGRRRTRRNLRRPA
jgi:predicted SprT family Zn-dependent metalloprotease